MEKKRYCDTIRELREDHDLTQQQVANLLGTTQQVYSRYENGVNELPIRQLIKLCQIYNVGTDYVLQRDMQDESKQGGPKTDSRT